MTLCKVWVHASSLALEAAVEVGGHTVGDASWLRKDDSGHITMAELDVVIQGLNLVLAWKVKKVESVTDSSAVHPWISDGLLGKSRLKTKATSEMLITVLSAVEEYRLQVTITLVPSGRNKADRLTCAAALVESASDQSPSHTTCVCFHCYCFL